MFAELCILPHSPVETSLFGVEAPMADAVDIRRSRPADVDNCRMLHDLDMQPPNLKALVS